MSIVIRYQGINSSAALFQKDVEGAVSIEILNTFSKGIGFWVFVISVESSTHVRDWLSLVAVVIVAKLFLPVMCKMIILLFKKSYVVYKCLISKTNQVLY